MECNSRMAQLAGNWEKGEEIFMEAERPQAAIQMYKGLHRWADAIRSAVLMLPMLLLYQY